MATRHGKDGAIKFGSVSVGRIVNWTLNEDIADADKSGMGDTSESHMTGLKNWGGTIRVRMDKDDPGQALLANGASGVLNLFDDGTVAGQAYHSGTATIKGPKTTVDIGSVIERSYDYKGNGDLSHPTLP